MKTEKNMNQRYKILQLVRQAAIIHYRQLQIKKLLPPALRKKFINICPLVPRLTQYRSVTKGTEFMVSSLCVSDQRVHSYIFRRIVAPFKQIEVANAMCFFGKLSTEDGGQISGLKSVDCDHLI